ASVAFSSQSVTGDLLALNSALCYAIYLILIKSLRDCFTSRKIIIWNSFTCAVLLLPIALLTSAKILPDTVQGWVVIALLALISQLLGHGLDGVCTQARRCGAGLCFGTGPSGGGD
ncbi:hypothetical protein PSYJA_37424, partial [Pseudomonas syringae pv. japonica str. M301072]